MKENSQAYKSIFLVVILVFGVATLYGIKTDETPRFLLFLGRFHPLLLHLPIGALVVTFFIDVWGRIQKNYSIPIVRNLLGFTAIFSIITCFLGYFLSLEGGYQKQTLDYHFYAGIITALLASTLFLLSLQPNFKTNKTFLPIFVLSLISISVTGHYGSVLTHGDNFLTEYARFSKKEKTIEVVDSLKIYENVIAKILDKKCVHCHNASKQKGELSLISEASILKGGKDGVSVVAANASMSPLYQRLLLPIADEKHMPPEGKEQLTKDEIWLLEYWINNGVDFKNYAINAKENDTLKKALEKYLVFNKIKIPKASKDDIEKIQNIGFRVLELVPGEAALNVKSLKASFTKETIDQLSALKEQIVELDFNDTELTDPMTEVIKEFKNLKTLRLNSPKITDNSISNFKKLERLEVLNIYNTDISTKGLSELLQVIQPKKIYAWKTNINNEKATQLQKEFKVQIYCNLAEGFVEDSRLEVPEIIPAKTLFTDSIHISAISRLKNVTLRYTLNGKTPDTTSNIIKDKIILSSSKTLKIGAFKKGWLPSDIVIREYAKVKQQVSNFIIHKKPDERYPDAKKLFDLEEGSLSFKDGKWVGYYGNDLQTTIDLGAIKTVDHISFSCLEDVGSWILYPTNFTVYASNTKNSTFKKIGELAINREGEGAEAEMKKITIKVSGTSARYFKVIIKNHKTLPKWHPAAGNPSWIFVDEIYFW